MTGIATKLKAAGYATHHVGKWDAGMATPDHTPKGRGFDSSFGYFHHDNDYYTETVPFDYCKDHGHAVVDLGTMISQPTRPMEQVMRSTCLRCI